MQPDSDDNSASQASSHDHYQLPSTQTLNEVDELTVLDAEGKPHAFKDLHSGSNRHIIVFVRHFFCGHCEDYVRALTKDLAPTRLSGLKPPTSLTIIGCGEASAIPGYISRTGCKFPIYTDPKRALYIKLGMVRSLDLGPSSPDYIQSSILAGTVKSAMNIIKSGTGGFKGGDYSQNGGEWMWEDGKLVWCHRMRNTRDHAEVKELEKVVGLRKD